MRTKGNMWIVYLLLFVGVLIIAGCTNSASNSTNNRTGNQTSIQGNTTTNTTSIQNATNLTRNTTMNLTNRTNVTVNRTNVTTNRTNMTTNRTLNMTNRTTTNGTTSSGAIDPGQFTTRIDNEYFTADPGTRFTYEGQRNSDDSKVEIYVSNATKVIQGVETRVIWERIWVNDDLTRNVTHYYAQDKNGNVWHFGEQIIDYDAQGDVKQTTSSRQNSWQAGMNNATAYIMLKADPKQGDSAGNGFVTERIVSTNEDVDATDGNYSKCLKVLEDKKTPEQDHYKYLCSQVSFIAQIEDRTDTDNMVVLDNVDENSTPARN